MIASVKDREKMKQPPSFKKLKSKVFYINFKLIFACLKSIMKTPKTFVKSVQN